MSGSSCFGVSARTTAGVYANKGCFGKLLIHFVKLRFTSFNFNSLFLKPLLRSRLQFIVCGCPLARQRRMSEQEGLWDASYPLRGLVRPLRSTLYSLFLKPLLRSRLQFIASLMSPDVRTQKFLCEAQKAFGEHNWRMPITRRARTARIGVSQPSRRVQRMSGLSCFRVSARTPAGVIGCCSTISADSVKLLTTRSF